MTANDKMSEITILYQTLLVNSEKDTVNAILLSEAFVNLLIFSAGKAQLAMKAHSSKLWLQFNAMHRFDSPYY